MNSFLTLETFFKRATQKIKHKAALSFLLLCFMSLCSLAQNSANIIVQPASVTKNVGESFTVNVRVDFTTAPATSSVDAVEVHLTFDKTKLQVASITKPSSAIMPNEAIALQPIGTINTNGQINYSAFTLSSFPNADFDLLAVTFNVIGGGGTATPLTYLTVFPNKTDAQRNGSSILGAAQNGSVTIQNCTAPTATIASAASSTICNGQPIGLRLTSATGVSPYSLEVNGITYTNVTVGSTFATIPFPVYNIWPSNPVPAVQNSYDGQPIEVGTKFRSTSTGFVKGIRVYIGSTSTGTSYTCKLWNPASGGTLLASTTFTPGSSGWQEVLFATPVSIAANTTYIASYYSASGRYVNTDDYFSSDVTNGPLTALQDGGVGGANGVYRLGAGGGMPTSTFASANYWADVVFTPNAATFNLTSVTDATSCTNTGALQTLNVISVDCSTLPVTLTNLSASPAGNKVTVRWTTSSEVNNLGFDVLRSTDGANWTKLGFVQGAGNSSTVRSYSYLDNNLEPRKYYYKLKQINIDQQFKYSSIVSATLNGKADFVLGQNFPNPFNNETTIQFTIPRSGVVNISLFDMNGRVLKTLVNGKKDAGSHVINLSVGTLSKGVYFYKMQAGEFTEVKKLTIQ